MKQLFNNIQIGLVRFSFVVFCIVLSPLLFVNAFFHRRRVKKAPFHKSLIVALCDKYPLAYQLYNFVMGFPLFDRVYAVLPRLNGRVLQVGCGTGALNIYLKRHRNADDIELHNLDTNLKSINYGLKRRNFDTYIHGDICKVPFEKEYFDAIVFARCFHHIRSPKKAFAECSRLLSGEGRIIICDVISLSATDPEHSYMMNSNFDGLIWRYTEKAFKAHIEKYLPPDLELTQLELVRQKHVTNYNLFYPHTDVVAVLKKRALQSEKNSKITYNKKYDDRED